jgi:hypothetical protein
MKVFGLVASVASVVTTPGARRARLAAQRRKVAADRRRPTTVEAIVPAAKRESQDGLSLAVLIQQAPLTDSASSEGDGLGAAWRREPLLAGPHRGGTLAAWIRSIRAKSCSLKLAG